MLLGAVRVYQVLLGPFLGGNCRFYPSCSHYTEEAIQRFGARRGVWLGVKRLLRCRPFGPSGYDAVPEELLHSGDQAHTSRQKHNRVEAAL